MKKILRWILPYAIGARMKARLSEKQHVSRQVLLYNSFLCSGDLVYDVGANIGNRIDGLLAVGAKVIAFEPQPECIRVLSEKYSRNQRVEIIKVAVGPSEGVMDLYVSGRCDTVATLSSSFLEHVKITERFGSGRKWNQIIKTPVVTLDKVIQSHGTPAFIKIDVEGFEPNVLAGLTSPVNVISFEWTSGLAENAIECIDKCCSLGMKNFQLSFGETLEYAYQNSVSSTRIKELILNLREDRRLFGDIYASVGALPRLS